MTAILQLNNISKTVAKIKDQKKKIVLIGGCFDILHIGHIRFIEKAKQQGDILIVLLESDRKIQQTKGIHRPIHSQKERAEMLASIQGVDYIILLPYISQNIRYDQLVQAIQPDIIATTQGDNGLVHKQRQAKEVGAKLAIVNKRIEHISTSAIFNTLQKEL